MKTGKRYVQLGSLNVEITSAAHLTKKFSALRLWTLPILKDAYMT